jgi:hypothetical protein
MISSGQSIPFSFKASIHAVVQPVGRGPRRYFQRMTDQVLPRFGLLKIGRLIEPI